MICGTRIIVPDNALNRTSGEFWKANIGKRGTFVCEESDGLWTVTLDHIGVVEGAQPARFLPLSLVGIDERPWWKRLLRMKG